MYVTCFSIKLETLFKKNTEEPTKPNQQKINKRSFCFSKFHLRAKKIHLYLELESTKLAVRIGFVIYLLASSP